MTDDKTPFYSLPLPHPDNLLQQDVLRIKYALTGVDRLMYMQTNLRRQQDELLNEKLRRVKLNQLLGEPLLTI
ncbi:hypothetical protein [Pseudoalteromonas luteoviolacea]|uniref:Uncharacterized protein n=2 Tax=Pseudoalteromonas luteoviolacea TaxID=43657 RepID=A0A167MRH5_9GAMM|nr:hypothetical protein [Pseudoalteromonas luteoviolacea]KZN34948.1 hypothetical protein N480_20395 [Pseudoalteromonas luteoviolacea S2607]KZN66841.1 hypothetical protein N478_18580 [Pseudoalteromonas luteoviolacea S4060-1]MBQ4814030.1 hypothetical protein [Pseudoalteromonas luteoviolacea]OCQ18963.1 hypothetical protein A7985_22535 [Pseudoalteromonas luteoviolacea]